jgi:hypothetical protein
MFRKKRARTGSGARFGKAWFAWFCGSRLSSELTAGPKAGFITEAASPRQGEGGRSGAFTITLPEPITLCD